MSGNQNNLGGSCDWRAILGGHPVWLLFRGFRDAASPPRMILALIGIVVIYLAGGLLDGLTPAGSRVAVSGSGTVNELTLYVEDPRAYTAAAVTNLHEDAERLLLSFLTRGPLDMNREEGLAAIRETEALGIISEVYQEQLSRAVDGLAQRYEVRQSAVEEEYDALLEQADGAKSNVKTERDRKLAILQDSYLRLFDSLFAQDKTLRIDLDLIVAVDNRLTGKARDEDRAAVEKLRELIEGTQRLAQAYEAAENVEGKGIFSTWISFNGARFKRVVSALVYERDMVVLRREVTQAALSVLWLWQCHWLFAILLTLTWLAVWAVFGGTISRMAAMQIARNERIGLVTAFNYSVRNFHSFFLAPLVPVGVICGLAILIGVGGLLGAVPMLGEILAALLMPAALLGGAIITLMAIGLLAGLNLMYPTIAMEGSDCLDPISRSLSYVLAQPWRMGFYGLIASVYGALCYIFVRLFAWFMMLVVHTSAGFTMNADGSALNAVRGKLDAIWPVPTFEQLQPAVNWMSLGSAETVAAAMVWIWVALVVGLVIAFVVSYYFTVNTTIYALLRQKTDLTNLDEVYTEEDILDLVQEEPSP